MVDQSESSCAADHPAYVFLTLEGDVLMMTPKEKILVCCLMLMLLMAQSYNAKACGDNITPDPMPEVSWPEAI